MDTIIAQDTRSIDSGPAYPKRLRLPFLDTRPIKDLQLIIILLPLWWFLGIDQIIWPIGFSIIGVKILIVRKGYVKFPLVLIYFLVFLFTQIISSLFIIEPTRWITYLRNFSVFISIPLLLFIVSNSVKGWDDIYGILKSIVIAMGIASLIGTAGVIDFWRPKFTSILGNVIPDRIANTDYGRTIVNRTIGQYAYFSGVGKYFRIKSFFAFATLYASALAYSLPVIVLFISFSKKLITRLKYSMILVLIGINLIFTTGRTALLSLILGGVYFYFIVVRKNKSIKLTALFLVISIGLIIFSTLLLSNSSKVISSFTDIVNEILYSRSNSVIGRVYIYQETIKGFLQRPVFGWGTERDIPEFSLPAGSHSYYLAILYRFGIIGLGILVLIYMNIWKRTDPYREIQFQNLEQYKIIQLLAYGRWVLIVAILDGFTTVRITDATTMIILWLIISALVASDYRYKWIQNSTKVSPK